MTEEHELYAITRQLRYDLTALQAKVSELLEALGRTNLPAPEKYVCQTCGLYLNGPQSLSEHVYVSHDGPVPSHWELAEERAAQ